MAKKVIFTEKQIKMLTESEIMKMKQSEEKLGTVTKEDIEAMLGKDLGDDADKKIEYPSQSDIEAMQMDSPEGTETPAEDNVSVEDEGAPELLEYLDKLEEAKSILSKIAAKEENENIKTESMHTMIRLRRLSSSLLKNSV